jgi:hypothetical protein
MSPSGAALSPISRGSSARSWTNAADIQAGYLGGRGGATARARRGGLMGEMGGWRELRVCGGMVIVVVVVVVRLDERVGVFV